MIRCPVCDSLVPEGKKFCRQCGAQLTVADQIGIKLTAAHELVATKLTADPTNMALLLEQAELLAKIGKTAQAAKNLEKVLAMDRGNINAMAALSSLYIKMNQPANALGHLEGIVATGKADSSHYLSLAELQFGTFKDIDQALKTLRASFAAFPSDSSLLMKSIEYSKASGRHDLVISLAKAYLDLVPGSVETLESLADAYMAIAKHSEALEQHRHILEIQPGNARSTLYTIMEQLATSSSIELSQLEEAIKKMELIDRDKLDSTEQQMAKAAMALYRIVCGTDSRHDYQVLKSLSKVVRDKSLMAEGITALMMSRISDPNRTKQDTKLPKQLSVLEEVVGRARIAPLCAAYHYEEGLNSIIEYPRGIRLEHLLKAQEFAQESNTLSRFPDLQAAIDKLRRQGKRRFVWSSAIILLTIIGVAAGWYFTRCQVTIDVDSDAQVIVQHKAGELVTLNREGNQYRTSFISGGEYTLSVRKSGYLPFQQQFTLKTGETLHLKPELEKPARLSLKDARSVATKASVERVGDFEMGADYAVGDVADLDDDGIWEVVLVWTMEGAKIQPLSKIYSLMDDNLVPIEGAQQARVFGSQIKFRKNKIHIESLVWKDTDPQCCPSLKEKKVFGYSKGKFFAETLDTIPIMDGEPEISLDRGSSLATTPEAAAAKASTGFTNYPIWIDAILSLKIPGHYAQLQEFLGRSNVLFIHPIDERTPCVLSQSTLIGSSAILRIGFRSAPSLDGMCTDGDFLSRIAIVLDAKDTIVLYDRVVANAEGWQDVSLDISKWSGNRAVTILFLGYATNWQCEFIAVDYFVVIPTPPEKRFLNTGMMKKEADYTPSDSLAGLLGSVPSPDQHIWCEKKPVLVNYITPTYPIVAMESNITAVVWVKILVGLSGEVLDVYLPRSTGYNLGLEEAAIDAAKATKWEPAIALNRPVIIWVTYGADFGLEPRVPHYE